MTREKTDAPRFGWSEIILAVLIGAVLGAVATARRGTEPRETDNAQTMRTDPGTDRRLEGQARDAGVIFYTTAGSLILDTSTCSLPGPIERGSYEGKVGK
jgi:hypothetical protein